MSRLAIVVCFGLAILLEACSGGKGTGAPPPRPTPLGAIPTANPDTPASQRSIWDDPKAQAQAVQTCIVKGPRQAESQQLCIADFMLANGASQAAVDFYRLNGSWLVAFVRGPGRMDAGLIQAANSTTTPPQLVFLNGSRRVQTEADLFAQAFPSNPSDGTLPFKNDPMFPALFSAAQKKFQGGDDRFDLKHFDVTELEAFSNLPNAGEEFLVEVAIHNYCHDCGIGVAARYAFDFEPSGKPSGVRLAGLCQGRTVTENIAGVGQATYHQFSGLKIKPGGGGVTEPYLVTVPGLALCPVSIPF